MRVRLKFKNGVFDSIGALTTSTHIRKSIEEGNLMDQTPPASSPLSRYGTWPRGCMPFFLSYPLLGSSCRPSPWLVARLVYDTTHKRREESGDQLVFYCLIWLQPIVCSRPLT